MSQKKRFTEIDALRGLAAIAVILFHYTTYYDNRFGHVKEGYIDFFWFGEYGVQLFFIISGFVIYMSVMKVKSASDFAIKRSIRLYPAYMFAVALTFVVVSTSVMEDLKVGFGEALINMTMLQDFFTGVGRVDGVYWTLRVELTFYVLMGILLLFGKAKHIMGVTLSWFTASVLIQVVHRTMDTELTSIIREYSIASFSHMFIIGMMFYAIWQHGHRIKYHLVIGMAVIYDIFFHSIENALFTLLFIGVFHLILNGNLKFLSSKVLVFFGTISYPVYLVHQNIGYVMINRMESFGLVHEIYMLVPIGVSILMAYGIYRYVEQPSQNALYKLYKERRDAYPKDAMLKR
ncbi:acyltransferase family protein [Salinicoccus bachuensis]|uniref:Acyltransferase family protein n=1 Tax=Salinicoccus bachuensis TaxID=3136731 RepID=A0ABZ3CM54_9STAP